MAISTKKTTVTRRTLTPRKAAPKTKASPKTKRGVRPRTRPAINTTSASRDGHEFHEAWVARKCLGLLLSGAELVGIAVEGFANEDQRGVSNEGNEIADAVLYFEGRPNLNTVKSVLSPQQPTRILRV